MSGADRSGRPRRAFAIGVARLVKRLASLTAHHGTALPGLVAEWIDPTILAELADGLGPVIVVLGTNGKTTTTRLVATILEHANGVPPVSNRSGANMRQGVVSAIIDDRPSRRAAARPAAVFELDELAFAGVVTALRPAAVVILNLLRDQLDRYGEIDRVEKQWVRDLAMLPRETILITCADDPRVEAIARRSGRAVRRFGVASIAGNRSSDPGTLAGHPKAAPGTDVPGCPECGTRVAFGGLGDWSCPSCGSAREEPDIGVILGEVEDGGSQSLSFVAGGALAGARPARSVRIGLTGSAAGYDAAAAVLAATCVGVALVDAVAGIDGATPAFGRLEEVRVRDKHVVLTLAKNPASFAQAAEAAVARRPDALLIGLSDQPADGRDVSWIWDAAIERLRCIPSVTLTGSRADDLLLRFKYASDIRIPAEDRRPIEVDRAVDTAFDAALERVRPGGTLVVLATYTALLGIRGLLERRGAAPVLPR